MPEPEIESDRIPAGPGNSSGPGATERLSRPAESPAGLSADLQLTAAKTAPSRLLWNGRSGQINRRTWTASIGISTDVRRNLPWHWRSTG